MDRTAEFSRFYLLLIKSITEHDEKISISKMFHFSHQVALVWTVTYPFENLMECTLYICYFSSSYTHYDHELCIVRFTLLPEFGISKEVTTFSIGGTYQLKVNFLL